MKAGVLALLMCLSLPASARLSASDSELTRAWADYLVTAERLSPTMRFPHHTCFERAAERHELPVTLLLAMARGESDFNPRAVSKANALGLMQILWPGTAQHLGIHSKARLFDPCTNVDAGARYIKELLAQFDGNLHRAMAAYNYGPSRIAKSGNRLPKGARWYSGYIYRHLGYVIRKSTVTMDLVVQVDYDEERKHPVVAFDLPQRAAAFIGHVEDRLARVRMDWFRNPAGRYQVVLLYRTAQERQSGLRALVRLGLLARREPA